MVAKLHNFQALNHIYIDLTNHYFAFSPNPKATFLKSTNKIARKEKGIFEEEISYEISLHNTFYNSRFSQTRVILQGFRKF